MKLFFISILLSIPALLFAQPEAGDDAATGKTAAIESYSRFDFIPGADLVYAEDFSQDAIGEFPMLWATNNRGEVVTLKGQQGNWLRLFHKSHFISPLIKSMPENFTAEFDMIISFKAEGYVYPNISFKLVQTPAQDKDGHQYVNDPYNDPHVMVTMAPGDEGSSTISLSSRKEGEEYFNSDNKGFRKLSEYFHTPFHVSMWVQKQRFRLWINGEKIYDIPQAIPPSMAFNRLALEVTDCYYEEEQVGVYIGNVRIAQGAPDIRNKLMTEGRLVTNGILFDVNSDKIKPESNGVIREIAKVLQDNPSLKVKITGFTDSDGDDNKNLELSKRRAAAVKALLEEHFQVDASRMQTDGKGEATPVADNKTKEGKAKNRRVEFIKL